MIFSWNWTEIRLNLIKIKVGLIAEYFNETEFPMDATTIQNECSIISSSKLVVCQQTQEGEHKLAISDLRPIKTHQSEVQVKTGFWTTNN